MAAEKGGGSAPKGGGKDSGGKIGKGDKGEEKGSWQSKGGGWQSKGWQQKGGKGNNGRGSWGKGGKGGFQGMMFNIDGEQHSGWDANYGWGEDSYHNGALWFGCMIGDDPDDVGEEASDTSSVSEGETMDLCMHDDGFGRSNAEA